MIPKMRIAELRKLAGYSTQEQFATALCVPRSTVAKWEAGLSKPRIEMLPALAEALEITIDALLSADAAAERNLNEIKTGKKTMNDVRIENGLSPVDCSVADKLLTVVKKEKG